VPELLAARPPDEPDARVGRTFDLRPARSPPPAATGKPDAIPAPRTGRSAAVVALALALGGMVGLLAAAALATAVAAAVWLWA
jgi:hypothetical protein